MVAAMKGGNVESLLVIAARSCFWISPKMLLAQMHKDICDGVGVSGDKIGTILVKLIKNILVGITDDELLAILKLRLKPKNDFTELLKTDELKESLSKDDQVMLDELEKDDERHDVMQADIQEIVRSMQKSKAIRLSETAQRSEEAIKSYDDAFAKRDAIHAKLTELEAEVQTKASGARVFFPGSSLSSWIRFGRPRV